MRDVMWVEGEKEQVEKIARILADLCRRMRKQEIPIRDMPLQDIVGFIKKVYNEEAEQIFVDRYVRIIADCAQRGDIDQLGNILELALYHAIYGQELWENQYELTQKTLTLQSSNAYYNNERKVKEWMALHGSGEQDDNIHFQGKGVVYSAVTGGYDIIRDPQYVNPNLDYILFTDDPDIRSDIWQIRLIQNVEGMDNTRLARKIKVLGHSYLEEYAYSIWVDGKMVIVGDLEEFVCKYRGSQPMLCFNHPVRDCIYEEEKACAERNSDDPTLMSAQMERYRREGYPQHNGLIESAVLVRELKDSRVIHLMEDWWQEVVRASRRDQLSFNYVCWKNDFVYDSTDLYVSENKYVNFCGHKQ